MRIYPRSGWKKALWWTALGALAMAGYLMYLVATRDPVNAGAFQRLGLKMNRADVEQLLGGPAAVSRITPAMSLAFGTAKPSPLMKSHATWKAA
jgi:hypothetical protein